MSIAIWDDSYRTGDAKIDAQHQELFRMVNSLHEAAVSSGGTKHVVGLTLEQLAKYTIEHFRGEEALMTRVFYPDLKDHKQKHQELTKAVEVLVNRFTSGEALLPLTISVFLAKWLRHHIRQEDMKMIKFVRAKETPFAKI